MKKPTMKERREASRKYIEEISAPVNAVNLVVPNTIEKKMEAIISLTRACEHLAKAIDGINLHATISNNVFRHCKEPAIQVDLNQH